MSSANYRLLNRISHSKLFNSAAISRLILTQKQCITTSQKHLFVNQQQISNNNLYNNHYAFSFCTKKTNDEAFDTDSDLSDFSDFSDSDESDTENAEINTKKAPPQQQKQKSDQWKFGHDDLSPDLIMKDRLIISNLNFSTNRNDLWELCENYGTVIDVHLPANKNRDFHNRGFGFVTFENDKDAQKALDEVAGIMYNSRQLRAGFARKDTEKPAVHNPTSQKLKDRSDFQFTARNGVGAVSEDKSAKAKVSQAQSLETLSETAITINGLPGNVNLAQITKMFNEFGSITNITFSPYRMFGHSFMNAIVSVNLAENKSIQQNNNSYNADTKTEKEEALSFQEQDIKDRSVDKSDMPTIRRNMNKNVDGNVNANANKAGGIDPDVLAKEIDELLADSDDSESESDSESDISSDDEEGEGDKDESSSDSDDDDKSK